MKIVSIIPARGNSKSIPKKNIVALGKHPLIAYSIATSKASAYIEETIVSTNSREIAEIAERYGATIPFFRPENISQDDSLDIEFFKHYLDSVRSDGESIPDLIVHLRPTTPLREINIVDSAIEYMMKNNDATALRSASKASLTPYKIFKLEGEFMEPFLRYKDIPESYNLPRQVFEDTYIPNGVVDIVRPRILLESGMLHGNKMKLWETKTVPDLDVLSDLHFAETVLKERQFKPLLQSLEGLAE